jgi:subtilisin family serine protease
MKRFSFWLLLLTSGWIFCTTSRAAARKELYVPGEIIVRYRVPQNLATLPASIQQLHNKFKLKQIHRLHERPLRRATSAALQAHVTRRQKRAPLGGVARAAGLREAFDRTYVLQFEKTASLQDILASYRRDPAVELVSLNQLYHYSFVPNDHFFASSGSWGQPYSDLWPLKNIQASAAWDISTGTGVVVAVVDSGIDYNHPDLHDNIWTNPQPDSVLQDVHGYNAVDKNNDPMDVYGHGTHVAGTIGAMGNNSLGVVGVAFNAKIMPVRAGNSDGSLALSAIVDAMRYAADHGADVINCSFGGGDDPLMHDAFQYAHSLGVVLVAAAGNEAQDASLSAPGNYAEVITVAATDHNDQPANFSNYGSKIDVAAPGGESASACNDLTAPSILSLRAGTLDPYAKETCSNGVVLSGKLVVNNAYYRSYGTSMAAPHVAGLAALILSLHPDATNEQVRQILRSSADQTGTPGFNSRTGYGRINALRALQTPTGPALYLQSPTSQSFLSDSLTPISGSIAGISSLAGYQLEMSPVSDDHGFIPIADPSTTSGSFSLSWNTGVLPTDRYQLRINAWDQSGHHYTFTQTPLYREAGVQKISPESIGASPALSGNHLVWVTDLATLPSKLVIYNIQQHTRQEIIAPSNRYFWNPHIDGDLVIYEDRPVFGSAFSTALQVFNLTTQETWNASFDSRDVPTDASVSGTQVVFKESNSDNIALYDYPTHSLRFLTTFNANISARNHLSMDGQQVVWDEHVSTGSYIVYMDLKTNQQKSLPSSNRFNNYPVLSGHRVTWSSEPDDLFTSSHTVVHLFDLTTHQDQLLAYQTDALQHDSVVSGDWVSWLESVDGNADVYLRNLQTSVTQRITVGGGAPGTSFLIQGANGGRPDLSNGNLTWLRHDPQGDYAYFYQNLHATTPATVTITKPSEGDSVTGLVSVQVSVQGGSAAKMTLYANGEAVTALTAAPFNFTWPTAALPPGSYALVAKAELTDGTLAFSPSVNVTIRGAANSAPLVSAGPDQSVDFLAALSLNGSATDDGLLAPLSSTWTELSGPGSANFSDKNKLMTTATFSQPGLYGLALSVFDGQYTVTSSMTVTVTPNSIASLPTPDLTGIDGRTYQASDTLSLTYVGNASGFNWEFISLASSAQTLDSFAFTPHIAAIATSTPRLSLATLSLTPGPYKVRVQAVKGSQSSAWASATFALAGATIINVRVHPNPFRASRGDPNVLFDQMAAASTVKIFTVSGQWVKTLRAPGGSIVWDLTNDSGDPVASGLYLYLVTDDQGNKTRGKLTLIR